MEKNVDKVLKRSNAVEEEKDAALQAALDVHEKEADEIVKSTRCSPTPPPTTPTGPDVSNMGCEEKMYEDAMDFTIVVHLVVKNNDGIPVHNRVFKLNVKATDTIKGVKAQDQSRRHVASSQTTLILQRRGDA